MIYEIGFRKAVIFVSPLLVINVLIITMRSEKPLYNLSVSLIKVLSINSFLKEQKSVFMDGRKSQKL